MAPTTVDLPTRPAEPEGPSSGRPFKPPFAAAFRDDWPRTNRVIPWLLAVFLVMLWLVPFDSTSARFNAPFDPKLDRFLISLMALAWVASVLAGGRTSPRWRRTPLDWAVLAFVGIAIASVLLNIGTLVRLNEHELALKKISLLLSYATFFFIVATTIRVSEIARFVRLFTGLAVICSVGVLYQKYVGANLFYDWWRAIVPGSLATLDQPPGATAFTAPPIGGPAKHPLALTLMLAIAIPFMLIGLSRARITRDRVLYAIGFVLLLSAVFATSRKTGSFASIAAVMTVVALRPKELVRFIPHAVVLFTFMLLAFPGATEVQLKAIDPSNVAQGASEDHRKSDYEAVVPDVRKYLVTGRGYGTYDPKKYRILDNNYLGLLLEVGFLGVAAFAFMVVGLIMAAWRPIRSPDTARSGPALAAAGAAGAFAVAMALFDALAYAQGPYMFFFLGAVAVVAGAPHMSAPADEGEGATEVLPALDESLEAEALPPLQAELEAERARQRRERQGEHDKHAGGRPRQRPLPPSRRRAQPVRGHVTGPRPGAPEPEPSSTRAGVSALGERARKAGAAASERARNRTGTILVGLAAFGLAVLAFAGGGTEQRSDAPRLGGPTTGDDPFGLDEFGRPGGGDKERSRDPEPARERAPRRKRPRGIAVTDVEKPESKPAPKKQEPKDEGRGEQPDRDRDRGRDRDRDEDRGQDPDRDRDPQPGPDENPDDERPEGPGERQEDCVSPEVDPLLQEIDIDACAADENDIALGAQNAFYSGKLSKAEVDLILDSLRRARGAR